MISNNKNRERRRNVRKGGAFGVLITDLSRTFICFHVKFRLLNFMHMVLI